MALIPNKYSISFGLELLNQGGALVHIYTDGSVLVTIGGVEMGQGLFTKCYQVGRYAPWLEKPGGTGRDLPLRAPLISFHGWDPGGAIYTKMGPFYFFWTVFQQLQ